MNLNFDNLRKNIAGSYCDLVEAMEGENIHEYKAILDNLGNAIAGLLAVYDPEVEGDVNDLSDLELIFYQETYEVNDE